MIYNVLQYLERSAERFPDKIALGDELGEITYSEYEHSAKIIGTYISKRVNGVTGAPVAVLIDRNIKSVCAFMGVVYSGNFYVPIDTIMPQERIDLIYKTLAPVLTLDARVDENDTGSENTASFAAAMSSGEIDEALLKKIRDHHIDTDPLYSTFTSGSSGVPKGVLICHRSVIDLVGSFEDAFSFSSDDVFGNQAPFDYDASVKDIYNAMYMGATMQIIPKRCFKTPKLLLDYLQEKSITTVIWAVSALRIVADFKALDGRELKLKNIMFSGEVMPVKSLNYWIDHVPEARYVNLYGPTEITCNCTYYIVDKNRRLNDDETLPAGKAFRNCRVFLINDKGERVTKAGESGEICVEGACLSLGYWNNKEKTDEVFVRNPLISEYNSGMYKTGDLGYYNDNNEIVFASRRDFQIKHMGHRIELGEIEVALNAIPFLDVACCIYDREKERIVCHYQADRDCKKEIVLSLSKKLPKYMWPNIYVRHDALPLNKNGKIDRVKLKETSQSQT